MIVMIHQVYLMLKGQLMVVFVLHMEQELELETMVLVAVMVPLLSAEINYQMLLL